MIIMLGLVLLPLVLQFCAGHVTTVQDLPVHAQSTLLKFAATSNARSVVSFTPIYRRDLDKTYPAYWQLITDTGDYLVISSGPKTGDYPLVMEGKIPSPTQRLDEGARSQRRTCAKYFMLAPGGVLMCENEDGRIAATSHDPFIAITTGDRYGFIESRSHELRRHWNTTLKNVTAAGIWNTSTVLKPDNKKMFYTNIAIRNLNETEEGISMGESVRIPVVVGAQVKVKYVPIGENDDLNSGQKKICDILKICSGSDLYKVELSKATSGLLGVSYVTIHPEWPGYPLTGKEFSFQIEILLPDDQVFVRRFGLDLRKRNRRFSPIPTSMAISDESYFPEYNQHMLTDRHCYVGCGPVSWAMIFGYFDRRSHGNPQKYGTQAQALWRCGPTGNEGNNSCVAPSRNTDILKHYTEHLNGIMGTFCIGDQGATPQWKMDDIVDYFKDRLNGANPTVEAHHDWLLSDVGLYEDKFRDNMMKFIQSGWPSVVGIRVDGVFSQHYPVASRYRQQVARSRSCIATATPSGSGSCAKWRSATEYDMYLHMGWGGSQNGWRKAGMFFSAAAKYDLPSA